MAALPSLLAPMGLRATAQAGCMVHVEWQRPVGPGQDRLAYFFRLYCREKGKTKFHKMVDGNHIYDHDCGPLKPMTEYEFKCQAYNMHGDGPAAMCEASTTEAPPAEAPGNMRCEHVDTERARIRWDPPKTTNGPVVSYKLFIDEEGRQEYVELSLPPTTTAYEHTHLFQDTTYRYQVLCCNAAGEGPTSDIICVTTHQDAASRYLKKERRASKPVSPTKVDPMPRRTSPGPSSAGSSRSASPSHFAGDLGSILRKRRSSVDAATRTQIASVPIPLLLEDDEEVPIASKLTIKTPVWQPPVVPDPDPVPEPEPEPPKPDEKMQQMMKRDSMKALYGSVLSKAEKQSVARTYQLVKVRTVPPTSALSKGVKAWSNPALDVKKAHWEDQIQDSRRTSQQEEGDFAQFAEQLPLKTLTGTIRGKKNAVRAALDTLQSRSQFGSELLARLHAEEHKNTIVAYVTSVQGVRKTHDDCSWILKLFDALQVKVQVKDVSMDRRFTKELEERKPGSQVPQVFINFLSVGARHELQELNDCGQLAKMLRGFEKRRATPCMVCGGHGWVPCSWCQGSKKSLQNTFEPDPRKNALRCTVCNENGLMKCSSC